MVAKSEDALKAQVAIIKIDAKDHFRSAHATAAGGRWEYYNLHICLYSSSSSTGQS